ncbi:MAG: glycogen debranching N-terminal domain-containing protein [Kofleriaceae bacterium]
MPDEIIQIEDQYYILATSSRADDFWRIIKHGESFGVFDRTGAIRPIGLGEQGVYHEGTRFLNRFEMTIQGQQLQLLRSTVRGDHVLAVDFTNPDYVNLPEPLPRASIHVLLESFLFEGSWCVRATVRNFSVRATELSASIWFGADYSDIFEIRGVKRPRRGRMLTPDLDNAHVVLGYEGLDGATRSTQLVFSPSPERLTPTSATFALRLPPHGEQSFHMTASFRIHDARHRLVAFDHPRPFSVALESATTSLAASETSATLETNNPRVHEWIERSAGDIRMMITLTSHGPYPYAGVPWFSTVFGRDGIITAFETLWLDPQLARGVIAHLAALQATALEPERDAEPGKIVHETRLGEMAALNEIPFGRYYGTIDATPLFIALVGAYWRRTAEHGFVEAMWPVVERALTWIERYGDPDGDGFIEYSRRSSTGLLSQGWKDSNDSVSHCDGTLAEPPIALCEAQGYVYAARRAAAELARVLGHGERAGQLDAAADRLREQFDAAFWSPELGTYYLALDGDKRPCAVRASNAGHALFTGIAKPERVRQVCDALLSPHSFSGWGIRTLDDREARYNPMSYHNGSVWPHDNAMAALGMARYGYKDAALKVLQGMYRASVYFDLHRMPELFCGFPRQEHAGPTPYPVACLPQAWAAGAVFMLLQACVGLDIDAPSHQIRVSRPVLPDNVDHLTIRNLRVGDAVADLIIERADRHVAVHVDRCDGELEIVAVKRDR